MKLTSRIGETKSVSLVKELIVDVHLDYIEKDGYVWRYNEDTKKYYNTGICLMGKLGNSGPPGRKGDNGLSAYLIAREHGFDGNVQAWLNSLKGKSVYEIAVENGFEGTEEEWLDLIDEGKSAYQIWQGQPGNENKSVSEFLAWMKDTSSVIGPKYAANTSEAIMINNTPTLYYIPNGSTFDVYLADEQGVSAKSLATGVPGDITNYAGIYDISQDKAVNGVPATYGNLSEALGAITEDSKKKGGMIIKYLGTDGKYHQYRYTGTSIIDYDFKNEINWDSVDGLQSKFIHENPFVEFTYNVTNSITSKGESLGLTPGKKYKVRATIDSPTTENIGFYMSEVNSGNYTDKLISLIPSIQKGYTTSEGIYVADDTHIYFATYINLVSANIDLTVNIEELTEIDKVPVLYDEFGINSDGAVTQRMITQAISSETPILDGVKCDTPEGNTTLFCPIRVHFNANHKYRIKVDTDSQAVHNIGFGLFSSKIPRVMDIHFDNLGSGNSSIEFEYETPTDKDLWLGYWGSETQNEITVSVFESNVSDIGAVANSIISKVSRMFFEKGALSLGAEVNRDNAIRSGTIIVEKNISVGITLSDSDNMPTPTYLYVIKYKDSEYVGYSDVGVSDSITIPASEDYDSVRILIYFASNITISDVLASQSYLTITPPIVVNRVERLEKKVEENSKHSAGVVYISPSDIEIDLTNEVLDLSGKTTTNQKFTKNNTREITSEGYKMVDNILDIEAGIYYVLDNNGIAKTTQVAYLDSNGNILRVHGGIEDSKKGAGANAISNSLIRILGATKMQFAVYNSGDSLDGLHIVKGRKFRIRDDAKREAFERQCPDGKINVAYIRDSQDGDSGRIVTALKLAGDFGIVKIPSGKYELDYCVYAGASAQSIEMCADTVLFPSDTFDTTRYNYLMEWNYWAIDGADPEMPDVDGNSSPIGNTYITGGVFDARGKCGCLRVLNFRGMTISGCQFMNAKTKGVSIEPPSYEVRMSNCTARNDMPSLAGNIGFNLVSDDCSYFDLVSVNYHIGFNCEGSMFLARCHPWIGTVDPATYYPGSVGFDGGVKASGANFTDCYSDCFNTHFRIGPYSILKGCTCLSGDGLYPDIMENNSPITLIESVGPNSLTQEERDKLRPVVIGCNFRGNGAHVHFKRKGGNMIIKEVANFLRLTGEATIDTKIPYEYQDIQQTEQTSP